MILTLTGGVFSGCSTLLKTISGETGGFFVDSSSEINYQGISMEQMHSDFRGECIYQAEVDIHFPQMTVGQTLKFAARARGMAMTFHHVNFSLQFPQLLEIGFPELRGNSTLSICETSLWPSLVFLTRSTQKLETISSVASVVESGNVLVLQKRKSSQNM
jgi:hypothetical protein